MMSVPSEIKEKSLAVCKNYLNGAWNCVSDEDFVIKPINGGLTNHIYLCELPARYELQRRENEPKKVLLRYYGAGIKTDNANGPSLTNLTENLLCAILAERKLGPKLYGVFNGGRIEEYIPARSLLRQELSDPDISFKIAEKLGKIHALKSLPFNKEPDKIFDMMLKWLHTFVTDKGGPDDKTQSPKVKVETGKIDWKRANLKKEIDFCKSLAHNSKSPIVFCHCDLQEGNILIRQRLPHSRDEYYPTDRIYTNSNIKLDFIDYEYSSYTYRAFDLANHFAEWTIDYTDKVYPFFSVHPGDFPTREQQLTFIRAYLRSFKSCSNRTPCYAETNATSPLEKITKGPLAALKQDRYELRNRPQSHIETLHKDLITLSLEEDQVFLETRQPDRVSNGDDPTDGNPVSEEEEVVLKEVQAFLVIVHLFWLVWSLVQSKHSTIQFGYQEHAEARYQAYKTQKAELKRMGKTPFGN